MKTRRGEAAGVPVAELGRPHIRWMIRRDMPDVLRAERESFEFAWTEDDFLRCLRQRNCIGMVAEHDDRIVGYMIYELHRQRLTVLNFAVAPGFRRCGLGRLMAGKLVGKLVSHRRSRICLAVRERNLPAQCFWRALDFRAVRVLRDYYPDSREDAFQMEYRPDWSVEDDAPLPLANRISRYADN